MRRSLFEPIILTTLLHLGVLFCDVATYYKCVVIISTILSVLWHMGREQYNYLFYLDYSGATIWFLVDIYYTEHYVIVITLNMCSVIVNNLTNKFTNYDACHSFWHLLNVIKSLIVVQYIHSA